MNRGARLAAASILASLAAALLPGIASGSTAQVSSNRVVFTAAAGETNNVTASFDGVAFRLVDPGSTITALAGCSPVSANEVACTPSGVGTIWLLLGNMNDRGTIGPTVVSPIDGDIRGEAGNDTLTAGPNISNFLSGDNGGDPPGDDTITGSDQNDRLSGSQGNDTLEALGGNDSIDEGSGNDVMSGGAGSDRLFGNSVPDGADAIIGGPGNDSIEYPRAGDVRATADGVPDDGEMGEGDNLMPDVEQISTGAGNDTVVGGDATNSIFTSDGNDAVDGGGGIDFIGGALGDDVLNGGPGADMLFPDRGTDTVDGGAGDDDLEAGNFEDEPDVYIGGEGSDRLDYSEQSVGVTVTLDGVPDDGIPGEGDNAMADLEDVQGTADADTITGNASANELTGGDGDDTLIGLAGPDGLGGDRGDDSLDGGAATDLITGDVGADRLRSRDAGPDEVSCGAGADAVLANRDDVPGASCEQTSTGVAFGKAKLAGEKAKIGLTCPQIEGVGCEGVLTLRKGKKKIGNAKFSIASGKSEKAKVKLKSPGDANKLKVDAEAEMTDATGDRAVSEKRLVLTAKGN